MKTLKNEQGLTLIEVVASIVLIAIILISFSNFFIQSKKTGISSASIINATYIAQVEMEKIYKIKDSIGTIESKMNALHYSYDPSGNNYTKSQNNYNIEVIFIKNTNKLQTSYEPNSLYNVIIHVKNNSNTEKASMENIYQIKE